MDSKTGELSIRCDECGAPIGKACVALGTSRYRRRGEPINGYHVKRVLAARSSGEVEK